MQPLVFLLFVAVINVGVCQKSTCDVNWHFYEDTCLLYEPGGLPWREARAVCKYLDATLVEIRTHDVNNVMTGYADGFNSECVWLGGNDLFEEGDWKWEGSRTQLSFTNWHRGKPNKGDNDEDCLSMSRDLGYLWSDRNCDYKCSFICTKRARGRG
ncbi:hypothetical protein BsWGS_11925 [Bradybaena similaris]